MIRKLFFPTLIGLAWLGACGQPGESERSIQSPLGDSSSNGAGGSGGESACPIETCVTIEMDKDISFIAYLLEPCPGIDCTVELFDEDWNEVNKEPKPHGQGKSCSGIDPSALKFDGLSDPKYYLCVSCENATTPGNLVITSKAGLVCETKTIDGSCAPCNGGGTGGGGDGGSGGDDCPKEY